MRNILFTIILFTAISANAQSVDNVFWGVVTNNDGKPVSNATITIVADSVRYTTKADKKGAYSFSVPSKDSLSIECSAVGYGVYINKFAASDKRRKTDIVLQNRSVDLDEVVIEGDNIVATQDKTVYIPNKNQVNAANSGISLLANLMIPQLDVNRITGDVSGLNGADVTFYIDGRKTSKSEIDQLRPKDVLRVEFYPMPTGIFTGSGIALNYVKRNYDYGGYVDVRTNTRVIYNSGDYSAQASFDRKKMNYTVLAGTSFVNEDDSYSQTAESFNLDTPFKRSSTTDNIITKSNSHYGVFRTMFNDKKVMALGSAGLVWNKAPDNSSSFMRTYTPDIAASTNAFSNTTQKSVSPYANAYVRLTLPKMQYLIGTGSFSYSDNKYNHHYTSGESAMASDVSEQARKFSASLQYHKWFAKTNSALTLSATHTRSLNTSDYCGTYASHQRLLNDNTIVYSRFDLYGKRLKLQMGLSMDINGYKVNKQDYTSKVYLRPSFTGSYTINSKSYIYGNFSYYNSMPTMNLMNGATQYVDEYMVLKGNPYLEKMRYLISGLSYALNLKKWSMAVAVDYFSTQNMAKDYFYPENDMMIHQTVTDGNFHSVRYSCSNSLYLLNKTLQIKGTVGVQQAFITGELYRFHKTNAYWNASVMYANGLFSATAYFNSIMNNINSTPEIMRNDADYGLSLTYKLKELFLEAGCRNIFEDGVYSQTALNTPYYDYKTKMFSAANDRQLYIKASYSFDFGRKVKRNSINVDNTDNSSILKVE